MSYRGQPYNYPNPPTPYSYTAPLNQVGSATPTEASGELSHYAPQYPNDRVAPSAPYPSYTQVRNPSLPPNPYPPRPSAYEAPRPPIGAAAPHLPSNPRPPAFPQPPSAPISSAYGPNYPTYSDFGYTNDSYVDAYQPKANILKTPPLRARRPSGNGGTTSWSSSPEANYLPATPSGRDSFSSDLFAMYASSSTNPSPSGSNPRYSGNAPNEIVNSTNYSQNLNNFSQPSNYPSYQPGNNSTNPSLGRTPSSTSTSTYNTVKPVYPTPPAVSEYTPVTPYVSRPSYSSHASTSSSTATAPSHHHVHSKLTTLENNSEFPAEPRLKPRNRPNGINLTQTAPSDAFYNPISPESPNSTRLQSFNHPQNTNQVSSPGPLYENDVVPPLGRNGSPAVRQPTILLDRSKTSSPATSDYSKRQGSVSSFGSISSHPTFSSYTSLSHDTLRRPSASLTPNSSSLGVSSLALQRMDSTGSYATTHQVAHSADFNPAFLSDIAVYVKDHVPKGTNLKGAVEYPQSFTGKEIVSTVLRALPSDAGCDRKFALAIAQNLAQNLWFHEVDWDFAPLRDSAQHEIYCFSQDEQHDSNQSRVYSEMEEQLDLPTAVLTNLTPCVSPFCSRMETEGVSASCYAYSCPNRIPGRFSRQDSSLSITSSGTPELGTTSAAGGEEAENWASSVPKSLLETMTKNEIAYQSLVFELISGEKKYWADLDLIERGFVTPLRQANPAIIPANRLENFLAQVLLNIDEIRKHSKTFLDACLERQKGGPVFYGIGQIILSAALDWSQAYTRYTVDFPMADYLLKAEKAKNPKFAAFLMDFNKLPEATRRGFDTFHNRATFRGLRYQLLLEQILKHTPETDPDREFTQQAIAVIKQQAAEANEGIATTKARVSLREYSSSLVTKQGDRVTDFQLEKEERKLFFEGKVFRRPDGSGFTDWSEAHLILFDHYLVTTKPAREREGRKVFQLSRRAVPLDLIQLKPTSFTEQPQPRTSGFLRGARGATTGATGQASPDPNSNSTLAYPIHFYQIGRYDGPVYYYVDSAEARTAWEKAFRAALSLRARRQEANKVLNLVILADQTFGTSTVIGSLQSDVPVNSLGRPTCSVPLVTSDGQSLIVAGCSEGLFIGYRGRTNSMRRVLLLAGISQCAVLPEFGFILLIANKILIAYLLEALVPSGNIQTTEVSRTPQRLSGQKDVSFFKVGKVEGKETRTLVIYAKKSGVKESVFKLLEPVSQSDRTAGKGQSSTSHSWLRMGSNKPEFFRSYKDLYSPTLVTGLHFHRSKLALVGARGMEIIDPVDTDRVSTVPIFPSSKIDRTFVGLQKRCEIAQTLGMFRLQDSKFLLVYDEFAFHVGGHGEPLVGPLIEWESKPDQIAYCAPYIFAFSPTLIEVRNAFTGHLAQFISGSQISMTYDGTAVLPAATTAKSPAIGSTETSLEKRIHFSMKIGNYHVLHEVSIIPTDRSNSSQSSL